MLKGMLQVFYVLMIQRQNVKKQVEGRHLSLFLPLVRDFYMYYFLSDACGNTFDQIYEERRKN